jgi:hypothetical protein
MYYVLLELTGGLFCLLSMILLHFVNEALVFEENEVNIAKIAMSIISISAASVFLIQNYAIYGAARRIDTLYVCFIITSFL